MTINICTGPHYSCEDPINWLTGGNGNSSLIQARNNNLSFNLGGVEIKVAKINRSFKVARQTSWNLSDGFLMRNSEGGLFQCGIVNNNSSGSLSEECTYITTQTHFLDTRYNNGIFTEITDYLYFSDSGEMCGFKETWGVRWYHKFSIVSPTIQRTTRYFIVVGGTKTVLKEKVESVPAYSSPLIIVYPNPPSLGIPWINCEDIDEYGFYDYHEGGPAEYGGSKRIEQDGGDDFYWPEWIREMGKLNVDQDDAMRGERYLTFYLNDPNPGVKTLQNPGILMGSTPIGSLTQDPAGNIFYSITFDGEVFNFLTDGNLLELFPQTEVNGQFCPVGLA
jgi:hypothetical protein